jgi:hypothetical protein
MSRVEYSQTKLKLKFNICMKFIYLKENQCFPIKSLQTGQVGDTFTQDCIHAA